MQPYIALAVGLRQAGFRAVVAAPRAFAQLVQAYDLPYAPLAGNPSELLARAGAEPALTYQGSLVHSLAASFEFWRAAQPVYAAMLTSAWQACQGSSAVLTGLPTTWGAMIAEALHVSCVRTYLQPLTPTRAFPSPLFPASQLRLPGLNRTSYWLVAQSMWLPWRAVMNRWRVGELKLKALGYRWSPPQDGQVLYGCSPQVCLRPPDWPVGAVMTGYWVLPPAPGWKPPDDLQRFLHDSGTPVVYLGFGSPGARPGRLGISLAGELAGRTGLRVVTALHGQTEGSRAVCRAADVPHEWLFPQLAGVIHHGGAGTTAAGLRAGVPNLICPSFGDQFYWGERVRSLGAGPVPLPQRKLDAHSLSAAVEMLLSEPPFREKAAALGAVLRAEDGVALAVESIQKMLT